LYTWELKRVLFVAHGSISEPIKKDTTSTKKLMVIIVYGGKARLL
jgi:hypothetical protein